VKLTVVAVGRLKAGWAADGVADYEKRCRRYLPVEIREVRDVPRRKGEPPDRWKAKEADGIHAALTEAERVVALDERGRAWSSRAFAEWLRGQQDAGVRNVAFVIGGPDGLDPSVRAKADRVWSLGASTMPHELARLVLVEQLYRAGTILAGLPYHRD
jgi:23S rRNA (pseudouridine1915-N3)-methyltransferase